VDPGLDSGEVPRPRSQTSEVVFAGRFEELDVLRSALVAAVEGPRFVWIEGPAGFGKSALVDAVLAGVPGMESTTVVRISAEEGGADLPYLALAQVGIDGRDGPFAAGLELVERLSRFNGDGANAGQVVVVVEDLHWADRASRAALMTAARRLDREMVALLVTSRPGEGPGDGWDRVICDERRWRRLALGPLAPAEVTELASKLGVSLTASAAGRLHAHTAGHPLYVRTLLEGVSAARLLADEDLPVPKTLTATILARMGRLPDAARAVAEALSVAVGPLPLAAAGRLGGVKSPAAAMDALFGCGLVVWDSADAGRAGFAHPLYRAAVYNGLAPSRRHELHRAAAEMADAGPRLAHLVAAAEGVDDGLADELARAAEVEELREAKSLAARYLTWASSLVGERETAESHLLRAALILVGDGQLGSAGALRERVEACRNSPRRDLVLGLLAWEHGDVAAGEACLKAAGSYDGLRGAVEPAGVLGDRHLVAARADRDAAVAALAHLGRLWGSQGRPEQAIEAGRTVLSARPTSLEIEQVAWQALVLGEAAAGGAPAGLARLAERLPQAPGAVSAQEVHLLILRGTLGFYAGRTTAAISDLRAAIRLVRQGAAAADLPRAHVQLAQLLIASGDWEHARLHAGLALSLVMDQSRVWMEAQAHAAFARVAAGQGQLASALEHAGAARRAAAHLGSPEAVFTAAIAEAAIARATNAPALVVDALAPLAAVGPALPMTSSLAWWPTLVAAFIDDGRFDEAMAQLNRLDKAATARGLDLHARVDGLRARLAIAAGESGAVDAMAQAVAALGHDDPLLDRADLHRWLGRARLNQGRRRAAIDELRVARSLLASAGAEPFLARLDDELASVGMPSSPRRTRSPMELTDRERDVVALVVRGLTNREVAGELYVGEKTVEYHLGNVYAKLGVSSRSELRRHLAN
jgi:DNA-binding CsgD family transcriptional regulator